MMHWIRVVIVLHLVGNSVHCMWQCEEVCVTLIDADWMELCLTHLVRSFQDELGNNTWGDECTTEISIVLKGKKIEVTSTCTGKWKTNALISC